MKLSNRSIAKVIMFAFLNKDETLPNYTRMDTRDISQVISFHCLSFTNLTWKQKKNLVPSFTQLDRVTRFLLANGWLRFEQGPQYYLSDGLIEAEKSGAISSVDDLFCENHIVAVHCMMFNIKLNPAFSDDHSKSVLHQ